MSSCATEPLPARTAHAALWLFALAAPAIAQDEAKLHATFGNRATRLLVPAIEWLCGTCLPQRTEWPASLDRDQAFAITLSSNGLRVVPSTVTLPDGVAAAGSCSVGSGPAMVFCCNVDGTEDWFVPHGFAAPDAWRTMLRSLQADAIDEPRSLDVAVVAAHLAGVFVDGDPRAELLRIGSASCGTVSWNAWSTPTHLRVRGGGDGGLVLPAALLLLATEAAPSPQTALALRAFGARDGDRAEAARQLVRSPAGQSIATLRALLQAEDAISLAAIDALVRLGRTDELPWIVAAAKPDAPWTSLAAADALRELWGGAGPTVRARTRRAVAQCASIPVRAVDLDRLTNGRDAVRTVPPTDAGGRARALVLLALFAIGLYGLWSRERAHLHDAA